MSEYETGATTRGANDLVLSVLNDGAVYTDRCHAMWADMQGTTHRVSFRDLANNEANKQRRELGLKFKAKEITEAAKLIRKDTLAHVLEALSDDYDNTRNICVTGRKWHDNVNGNTYFSCWVSVPCKSVDRHSFAIPFQYGYGDQWQWEAVSVLKRIGIIEDKANAPRSELPIDWNFDGVTLKRNMYNGIYF